MPFHDITVGAGFQVITIDLTGSDADLLADLKYVRARVFRDEDAALEGEYEAAGRTATLPAIAEGLVAYDASTPSPIGATSTTKLRLCHNFKGRGLHLISISIEDTLGNETFSVGAVRVGVGDGLPREIS